jgi:linoleate 10R-lipoxygenase
VLIRLISSESKYTEASSISEITADKGSVGNLSPIHFAANVFSLPLKTDIHPRGVYSEHELYMALAVMFTCLFLDLDPAKSFPLRQAALAVSQHLGKLIEENVKAVHSTGFIAGVADKFHQEHAALKDYGV